jgi:hypothetical protein
MAAVAAASPFASGCSAVESTDGARCLLLGSIGIATCTTATQQTHSHKPRQQATHASQHPRTDSSARKRRTTLRSYGTLAFSSLRRFPSTLAACFVSMHAWPLLSAACPWRRPLGGLPGACSEEHASTVGGGRGAQWWGALTPNLGFGRAGSSLILDTGGGSLQRDTHCAPPGLLCEGLCCRQNKRQRIKGVFGSSLGPLSHPTERQEQRAGEQETGEKGRMGGGMVLVLAVLLVRALNAFRPVFVV